MTTDKAVLPLVLLSVIVSFVQSSIISQNGEAFQQAYGLPPSMLPLLPSGKALKLSTSPNSGLLGGTIWPAAHALCSYLLENGQSLNLQNAHCVELGSGTGAVGLFAAALGASSVTLTDCRPRTDDSAIYTTDLTTAVTSHLHPESAGATANGSILQLLHENMKANRDLISCAGASLKVEELDWTKAGDIERVALQCAGGYDLVLASDVTHFSALHEPLASTIARLLTDKNNGKCLLTHQERMLNFKGQDLQLKQFELTARSKGLHVKYLPSVSMNQNHKDQNVGVLPQRTGNDANAARISMLLMTTTPTEAAHGDAVSSSPSLMSSRL